MGPLVRLSSARCPGKAGLSRRFPLLPLGQAAGRRHLSGMGSAAGEGLEGVLVFWETNLPPQHIFFVSLGQILTLL